MKNSKIGLVVSALALIASGSAFAQSAAPASSKYYVEAGYTNLKLTELGAPDMKPAQLRLIGGINVHPNLAIEGMYAANAKTDHITVLGVTLDVRMDNAYGLFLKPQYQVSNELNAFARLGYVKAKLTLAAGGLALSDKGDSAAYGAGVSYKITPTVSANLDYMSYYNKDGAKIKGYTVAIGYAF